MFEGEYAGLTGCFYSANNTDCDICEPGFEIDGTTCVENTDSNKFLDLKNSFEFYFSYIDFLKEFVQP